ncbi:uncharacterized protein LOC144098009 [Amblyomma americanum]
MCWSNARTTLLFVSLVCMCMNGFNLSSRAFGYRDKLKQNNISAYLPDVTDLSKWLNGRKASDSIIMGLAGVSLIFDFVLFVGAAREHAGMIEVSGFWGSIDCAADAVIGFLSANYTLPLILLEDEKMEDEEMAAVEKRTQLLISRVPPATVKQILHFVYVIMRLLLKSVILCILFEYEDHLYRREIREDHHTLIFTKEHTGHGMPALTY